MLCFINPTTACRLLQSLYFSGLKTPERATKRKVKTMKRIMTAAALMAAMVCFGTKASAQTVETKVKSECCKAGTAVAKTCCKAVSDTAKAKVAKAKCCAAAAKTKATTATAKVKKTAKTAKTKAANVKKAAVDATTAATTQVKNATK